MHMLPAPPLIADQILTYQQDERAQTLVIGTPAWYAWLRTATTFTFTSDSGSFTAHREQAGNKRGGWYWRAYRQRAGRLRRVYLGKSESITPERLSAVAARLAAEDEGVEAERAHARPSSAERAARGRLLSAAPGVHSARHAGQGTLPGLGADRRPSDTLPLPLTSLVGRERELAAIRALLAQTEVRELTLSGTGGVGKTRLALEIAATMRDAFPDGVSFVSLAALDDADLVLPTIAQAVGLQTKGARAAAEALRATLRERRQLLVLDNFEHVIAATPDLVDLLVTCPQLKLLVTSREALRVRGEHEFVVQPLALPEPTHHADDELRTYDGANETYGAVSLFLERGQAVQPTLAVNARTAPLMIEICQRLDGLPLAIELAAARLKALSLQALRERLEQRLQVLTGGPRDLPARQQTMRQTIAWSYDLLSHEEQRLFRLLCVFVDGCTLDAAETVYSMVGGDRAQVLDVVMSLLDKHLLYQRERGDGDQRLLMHETIREYGLEALVAAQEMERARQLHATYYLGLVETRLVGVELAALLEQFEHEYANLHAALQWALVRPASEVALRLERALLRWWEGHQRTGNGAAFPNRGRASSQGKEALTPDRTPFAPGMLATEQSDHERSAAMAGEAPALERKPGDAHHIARSLYLLGVLAWVTGDFATARSYAEEGLARARPLDDKVTLAYLLDLLGQIALDQGEDTRARTPLEQAHMLHREAGDTLGSLNSLFFLERALAAQGEVARARAFAREHLALAKAIGFQSGVAGALTFLGRLALETENTTSARALFEESLTLLHEMRESMPVAVATNLQGIGVTLATLGRPTEAVGLWGAAEALSLLLPEERAFVVRARAAVRAQLSHEAFATAWAEGQAMTLEQALEQAQAAIGRVALASEPPGQATRRSGKGDSAHQPRPDRHGLTKREVEALRLVARGMTDAQIADALVISRRTVNAHLRSIYRKLHITSRNAATYFALEHDLI